jgi:hypothetical protein
MPPTETPELEGTTLTTKTPLRPAPKSARASSQPPASGDITTGDVAPKVSPPNARPERPPETVKLVLKGGRAVDLEIPGPNPDKDYAIFVLGVRKSGSTLLNKVWARSSKRLDLPFVDIGGGLFKKDIRAGQWADEPSIASVFRPGCVYGGFRSAYLHFKESPVYVGAKKVLLVRDPRDALVSQYFSTLKTHSMPTESTGPDGAAELLLRQREAAKNLPIDDFVLLNARSFRRTMQEYIPLLEDENLKVFRYEDIILDKGPWIQKMLRHTGLPVPKAFVERIAEEFNVIPTSENQENFIRKVTPGDHQDKLKKSTIEALNLIFADVASEFGYRLR